MQLITELLKTKYPIIQGGMSRLATHELVAAVSAAGGLGTLTSVGMDGPALRHEIQAVREQTNQPFAVNLMLKQANIAELVDVIIQEQVPFVTTGAGTPKAYMPKLQAAGVQVLAVIPSVKLARKMEQLGVAAVIAEGLESGGHIGNMTTMALVPQVVDAVQIPVIAAGGIGDGRGIAAALALGAQGVQMGTAFLLTQEAPINAAYKEALVQAGDIDTDVTEVEIGTPLRTLKNSLTQQYHELVQQGASAEELMKLMRGRHQAAFLQGDMDQGAIMAGQISGLLHQEQPVATLLAHDWQQAQNILSFK
ncbi:DUF561 domain-containing protein [Weissella kandleri]|uniref:DUF561 domain-containing protein n=1 Tax=Weissella kandleri TaxID=1616 RepID=UPI00387EA035